MVAILNFQIFHKNCKTQNAYISKTMLDRADCVDFGCHNSVRLEAEHFLNTLALTFISFSGRFVFAVQKHCLFSANNPLVILGCINKFIHTFFKGNYCSFCYFSFGANQFSNSSEIKKKC